MKIILEFIQAFEVEHVFLDVIHSIDTLTKTRKSLNQTYRENTSRLYKVHLLLVVLILFRCSRTNRPNFSL